MMTLAILQTVINAATLVVSIIMQVVMMKNK